MTGELIPALRFAYLAADEAVGMLTSVKIVESPVKVESALTVLSEHYDERGVPHEEEPVERGVYKRRAEAALLRRVAKVGKCDPPRLVVAGAVLVVTVDKRLRKQILRLVVRRDHHAVIFADKNVFFDERVFLFGIRFSLSGYIQYGHLFLRCFFFTESIP